jgi:hypothetical protein
VSTLREFAAFSAGTKEILATAGNNGHGRRRGAHGADTGLGDRSLHLHTVLKTIRGDQE